MFGVECLNLKKIFSDGASSVAPVNNLSLTLSPGKIHALIGESGCGKTTLLRLIAGLEKADQGNIRFTPSHYRPRVSIVFQEPRLFPWLTVEKNIALSVRHLSESAQKERVHQTLSMVNLLDARKFLPSQLSGGMAQRVALARALCPRPDILLLDEAFSALDALTRSKLYSQFIHIHEACPVTTLLVTHDVTEAVLLADEVFRLGQGQVRHHYRLDFAHPRTLANASVGEMIEMIYNDFFTPMKGKENDA